MGQPIDRKRFASEVATRFGKALKPTQQTGCNAIFDYWEKSTLNDTRWLAYALATAWHETGTRMEPVREGFASTDAGAIQAVTTLFKKGKIKRNYALPHPNGQSYFGRGLVQITHGNNYERLGKAIGLGMKLYDDPGLALQLDVSVAIMFVGMTDGLFTTKRFADYFNPTKTDWTNARRIINGLDRAAMVAGYAKKFLPAL